MSMIYRYVKEMEIASSIVRKKIIWRGLVNSSAQSIPFFSYAVALYAGGLLVANGEIHFKNVIKFVFKYYFVCVIKYFFY